MSLAYYTAIRNQGYEYRGLNFVRIGKDMHVFVGNISYIMDFTILENVEANIDPSLSQVVFGWPFVEVTKLILDKEHGLITFTDEIKDVTFKTPYIDSEMDYLTTEGHDLFSSRVILSEDAYRRGCERPSNLESGFHKDIDKLGPSYKREIKKGSNTTLMNHITYPHCEVIKAQKNQNLKARQTSMARDGSVF
nr:protein kinase-like domain, concanavalin A-like lectin/glucanase domain protein [Tanacetum cinerariifolium]